MTDRDRLIELMKKADKIASNKLIMDYDDAIADNADYLLANGVIVPPCKVGDMVYYIINNNIQEVKVSEIKIYGNNYVVANAKCLDELEMCDCTCDCSKKTCNVWFDFKSLGKTVVLTKEEAEAKLKEREG
jgi:hypothetical protein